MNDPGNDASTAGAIGVATLASGVGLVLAPRLSLRAMGATPNPPSPLLFRVVGMFMVVCGGLLFDASRAGGPPRVVLRWSATQKIGATAAMTLGVVQRAYKPRALLVAAFDGACALVLLRQLRSRSASAGG